MYPFEYSDWTLTSFLGMCLFPWQEEQPCSPTRHHGAAHTPGRGGEVNREGCPQLDATSWSRHNQSSVCHPQKWRGWMLSKIPQLFMTPPHFKMEGLYMVPSVVRHKWTMVRQDLKDVHLTVPMVQESWSLLAGLSGRSTDSHAVYCLPSGPYQLCSQRPQSPLYSFCGN